MSQDWACSLDPITVAAGSVRLAHKNGACLVCTANGPSEVKLRDELITAATVQVSLQPINRISDPSDRDFEKFCREILEKVLIVSMFPRSLLSYTIQQLQDSPSFLSAAVNAISLATVRATIPLREMFAAVAIAFDESDCYTLFPRESLESQAVCTFIFTLSLECIAVNTVGPISADNFEKACELAASEVKGIFGWMRSLLAAE